MDKILKNDKVMGIVAIATLVLVGIMFWTSYKANKENATVVIPETPGAE